MYVYIYIYIYICIRHLWQNSMIIIPHQCISDIFRIAHSAQTCPGAPAARVVQFRCSAEGNFENLTGQRCAPWIALVCQAMPGSNLIQFGDSLRIWNPGTFAMTLM